MSKAPFYPKALVVGLFFGPLGLLFVGKNNQTEKIGCAIIGWVVGWILVAVVGTLLLFFKQTWDRSETRNAAVRSALKIEELKAQKEVAEELATKAHEQELVRLAKEEDNKEKKEIADWILDNKVRERELKTEINKILQVGRQKEGQQIFDSSWIKDNCPLEDGSIEEVRSSIVPIIKPSMSMEELVRLRVMLSDEILRLKGKIESLQKCRSSYERLNSIKDTRESRDYAGTKMKEFKLDWSNYVSIQKFISASGVDISIAEPLYYEMLGGQSQSNIDMFMNAALNLTQGRTMLFSETDFLSREEIDEVFEALSKQIFELVLTYNSRDFEVKAVRATGISSLPLKDLGCAVNESGCSCVKFTVGGEKVYVIEKHAYGVLSRQLFALMPENAESATKCLERLIALNKSYDEEQLREKARKQQQLEKTRNQEIDRAMRNAERSIKDRKKAESQHRKDRFKMMGPRPAHSRYMVQ